MNTEQRKKIKDSRPFSKILITSWRKGFPSIIPPTPLKITSISNHKAVYRIILMTFLAILSPAGALSPEVPKPKAPYINNASSHSYPSSSSVKEQ